MNSVFLLMLPLVAFHFYLATLRVLIYWRMVKHKSFLDYIVALWQYRIAVVPLAYLHNIADPVLIGHLRRHDSLVKYYYLTMLLTGLSMVIAYRIMQF